MQLNELKSSDYPQYYQKYLDQLEGGDLLSLLESQKEEMSDFLRRLSEKDLLHSYAPGKWTVAEVLQHLIDTERIFQYRALRISRQDPTPLPGFDQDLYVPASMAKDRTGGELLEEYIAVRESGIQLFRSFKGDMWKEKGTASGGALSAAAAGFIIAGHEKHHLQLFKTNYNL